MIFWRYWELMVNNLKTVGQDNNFYSVHALSITSYHLQVVAKELFTISCVSTRSAVTTRATHKRAYQ